MAFATASSFMVLHPPAPSLPPAIDKADAWLDFLASLDTEDFISAGRIISDGLFKEYYLPTFYDSQIKRLLLQFNDSSTCNLDESADSKPLLRKVLRTTEFLESQGIESGYCRLCRAAVYLKLGEGVKLSELIKKLCVPREYQQSSDLLQLNQLIETSDEREMSKLYFLPLHTAIIEEIERQRPEFPINSIDKKA